MLNNLLIRRLVGVATLTALVVALQLLSNYVTFGQVSITLALIPVAVGAILYGPYVGGFLGFMLGAIALTAPSTGVFLNVNPGATVLICLLKTSIAGLLSGYIFKLFAFIAKKQNNITTRKTLFATGVILAALIVPPVNTFLFCVGSIIWFKSVMGETFVGVLVLVFATNFLIEFIVSVILSPALVILIKVLTRNYNLGFVNDFSNFIEDDEEDETLEEAVSM